MTTDFTDSGTDFSALYRDPSAPKDVSPSEDLYNKVSTAVKAPAPVGSAVPQAPAAPPAAAAPASPKPAVASTSNASGEEAGLLARLAPLGITSLAALKTKTDVELRKLTGDVVAYEARQTSLGRNFSKNPDGSWDFSKGPDGSPTGLDATGKVLPPAGTASPAAAPAPSSPKPAAPVAPAAKAAAPAAKRPVRVAPKPTAKRPTVRKPAAPTVRPRPTAKRPPTRPAAKPVAKKVTLAPRAS